MITARYIAFWATILIFVACSERMIDPVTQAPGSSRSYIFFEPEVYTSVNTKALGLVTGDKLPAAAGTAFGVLGYYNATPLFNGITEVKRSTASGPFNYEGLVAWQDNTTSHDFYAIYPYDDFSSLVTTEDYPKLSYTQPNQTTGMIDLMTAKTSTTKTSDNNVPLTFHHRLWGLDVKIKNSMTKGLAADGKTEVNNPSMTITKVELYVKDFPQTAVIPLDPNVTNNPITYGTTTMTSSTPYEISVPDADKIIAYNQTKSYGVLLFIPLTSSQKFNYRLVISYTDLMGSSTFTFPATGYKELSGPFDGGKKYTLTLNKTNDAFVSGVYEDPDDDGSLQPGDWNDEEVKHEFN